MFDFVEDYYLENEVVGLSPLLEEHTDLLFPESNHPDVWRYFLEDGFGEEKFKKYVHNAVQKRVKGLQYPFVIRDKKSGSVAGITRLYEVSNRLGIVKIGHTWIGKTFQGTGLNKNCKYLLFEFLFEKMGMNRIGFGASAENKHSIRAMKSVGCKEEGMLRSYMPGVDQPGRVDVVLLSLLKEEWEAEVKSMLLGKIAKSE